MNTLNGEHTASVRIALAIEYDGAAFCGWQKQAAPELPTVQSSLEKALTQVADSPITTSCAGRTDAGVHAGCQVVHFDAPVDRGAKAWIRGVNSLLPPSVRVLWALRVDDQFHARFSAQARRYHYILYNRPVASALLSGKVTHWRHGPLDIEAMNEAACALVGEQDFSAFQAAGCQSRTPFRNVHHARFSQQGVFTVFDIQANAFLQHMVRNIMGSLLVIGQGLQPPDWIRELLARGERSQAGATAAAEGLYLVAVTYPEQCGLPSSCHLPPFLAAMD